LDWKLEPPPSKSYSIFQRNLIIFNVCQFDKQLKLYFVGEHILAEIRNTDDHGLIEKKIPCMLGCRG
jgi:hypothetical protein